VVLIRGEEPRDREAALEVERLAFGSGEEPDIVVAVRDDEGSFGLVAEDAGDVVGHVQFSRGWIGATPVLALGPVGVRPDRQGEGIGSGLIRAGLGEAHRRGEVAVMLLGSPAFYPRFGFVAGATLGLSNPFTGSDGGGFEIAEEDFMVARLADVELSGRARWHPAFGGPVEGPEDGA
jgi:putative acetyltransferase